MNPSTIPSSPRGGFLPEAFSSSDWTLSDASVNNEQLGSPTSSYGQLVRFEDEEDEENIENSESTGEDQDVLLYLIRHGEAEHNIEEKKAMEVTRRIAVEEEGLSEDDPTVTERMEEARKAVLNDVMLRDAKLSEQGKIEARQARDKLRQLIADDNGLDKPDYVLVSPLTRTMETCDIIFPDSENIHVREEISERRTGKPPDTRSSVHWLSLRPSFQRFSMDQLQTAASHKAQNQKARLTRTCSSGDEPNNSQRIDIMTHSHSHPEIFVISDELFNGAEQNDPQFTEEDREQLRARTETLFALLCEANSFSVAVVTHKGYLRELERGPFGQPDAAEFENGEIRVYRITMRNKKLVRAERVYVNTSRK